MITIAFFNNKGGVGKTSLVYHLAWMYAELGVKVIAADLDPQANLTSMFLEEDRLEKVWPDGEHPNSVLGVIRPILRGIGDINACIVEPISDSLGLIIGDLGLSGFEDKLSDAWPRCHDGDEASFRIMSALYRLIDQAAAARGAQLALIDVGPNLGAINRAAIIAARYVTIPLAPDLYSLQGLRNLGPTLRRWRSEWNELLGKNPDKELDLPKGEMEPMGYVVMQHAVRSDRPVKAYGKWMNRVPGEYRKSVLGEPAAPLDTLLEDSHCLALLKHFRSLMPMAMEARKPMFALRPSDGAIGAHVQAVQDCYNDFKKLALKIAAHGHVPLPSSYATVE
jgi:cellulose biosynthesis protein BcsQ